MLETKGYQATVEFDDEAGTFHGEVARPFAIRLTIIWIGAKQAAVPAALVV